MCTRLPRRNSTVSMLRTTKKQSSRRSLRRSSGSGLMPILQTIMPERQTRWLTTTAAAYVIAGNATASAGNYMAVAVNSVYLPFNTTYPVNTSAATFSMHGSFVQGTVSATPMGLQAFAALYNLYKVHRYRITVIPQSNNSADNYECVLLPLGSEQIPSASAAYVNLEVMTGQPRSRSCTAISGAAQQRVSLDEPVHVNLGKRRSQWLDIDSVPLTGAPATQDTAYCGIFLQQLNGSANAAAISFTVVLEQEVEFSGLIRQIA